MSVVCNIAEFIYDATVFIIGLIAVLILIAVAVPVFAIAVTLELITVLFGSSFGVVKKTKSSEPETEATYTSVEAHRELFIEGAKLMEANRRRVS